MIDLEDRSVHAISTAVGNPIIRRDTNTTVVKLHDDEVLALIAELAREVSSGTSVYLIIEKNEIYPREVFE